ncbi:polyphosphate kinase 2 [candidate division KSB1 bacterium]|nr:polyphosphate kinase 2 [candidate division KSB1 bacterium]
MIEYSTELRLLQTELVKLQKWVIARRQRIVIIFEGRDTAGKGGAIRRFTRYLNPRHVRVVALPVPTDYEKGQWYFQRFVSELPSSGEMTFFDRSWYNRAVVEPVMGFCTTKQYERFLRQVPDFEYMLYEDGIIFFKFWFSIDIEEQKERLKSRSENPLKHWKLSTTDMVAQRKWHEYTRYKEVMFETTHRDYCPWIIIKGNDKKRARLESMRYVLSKIEYTGKSDKKVTFQCDSDVLNLYQNNSLPKGHG